MKTALRGCGCIPNVSFPGVFHSAACRLHPGEKLSTSEREGWVAANRAADREQERTRLAAAVLNHPAKGDKTPLRWVKDPDYVDHWIDRDDDA